MYHSIVSRTDLNKIFQVAYYYVPINEDY
jgi:hypothetical protein